MKQIPVKEFKEWIRIISGGLIKPKVDKAKDDRTPLGAKAGSFGDITRAFEEVAQKSAGIGKSIPEQQLDELKAINGHTGATAKKPVPQSPTRD